MSINALKYVLLSTAMGIQMYAFGTEIPGKILHYDFSSQVIRQGGDYAEPKFKGHPVMSTRPQSLELEGYNSHLIVPKGESVSLSGGGTLFAVVKFMDDGKGETRSNVHDMIFFKYGEFLLGRTGEKLYFNAGDGKIEKCNWVMSTASDGINLKKWVAVAAVLVRKTNGYEVRLYIDGRKVKTGNFQVGYTHNVSPLTIGLGWGYPWALNGSIGSIRIYDRPLDDRQIAELTGKSMIKE